MFQDIGKGLCQDIGKTLRYNRREGDAGDAVEGDRCNERETVVHRSNAETGAIFPGTVPRMGNQREDGVQMAETVLRGRLRRTYGTQI